MRSSSHLPRLRLAFLVASLLFGVHVAFAQTPPQAPDPDTTATASAPRASDPDAPAASAAAAPAPAPVVLKPGQISFRKSIAPLLIQQCQACHGPDKAQSNYRIDTFDRLKKPGDNSLAPFTPNDPSESELLRLITTDDKNERMPKDGEPLKPEQIAAIKQWIAEGAIYDHEDAAAPLATIVPRATQPNPPEQYAFPTPVTALAFHPTGNELFAAGYHEITVWNPTDGKLVRRIKDLPQRIHAITFSPDAALLAVAAGTPGRLGEVLLVNPADGAIVRPLATSSDEIFDAAFSPDGKRLATAGADRAIRVFDVATGKQTTLIENHADWVMAIAWSSDGTKLASASRDKTAKVFEAATGSLLATHSGHGEAVYGVAFKPDGKLVYSAGRDRKIRIWKVEDGANAGEIGGFNEEVYKIALRGEFLFAPSADKSARQIREPDRNPIRQFSGHNDWVYSIDANLATKRVATGTYDGEVRLWNLDDGKPVLQFFAAPGYAPPAAAK